MCALLSLYRDLDHGEVFEGFAADVQFLDVVDAGFCVGVGFVVDHDFAVQMV